MMFLPGDGKVMQDTSPLIIQGNLKGGTQWCFAKSFDTFCPLGPSVVSKTLIPNPNKLALSCVVNGRTLQSSNTEDMIFDVPSIIAFLSQGTTLPPGTIILTGKSLGISHQSIQEPRKVLGLLAILLFFCLLEIQ